MKQNGLLPVSVIVPVFNAEFTLERCIKSINTGSLPEEIILVDDCSSDNSVQVARKLASAHENVRLITRSLNGGAAEARRDGLRSARCDFYSYVDADDYLDPDALLDAYNRLIETGSDICIWQLWRARDSQTFEFTDLSNISFPITGLEAAELTLGAWSIHPLGVARKEVYLAAYSDFSESSANADELITRLAFLNAKKVVSCDKRYFYVENPDSTTRTIHPRRLSFLDSDLWLLEFCKLYAPHKTAEILKNSFSTLWSIFRKREILGIPATKAKCRRFTRKVCLANGFGRVICHDWRVMARFIVVSIYCRLPG